MKPKATIIRIEEPEDDNEEMELILNLLKKQAELDKKLQSLVVAVAATGE